MLLLPAFVFSFIYMYWSLPLACILYKVRFLSFGGKRDDTFQWSKMITEFFGAKIKRVGEHSLFKSEGPVFYLHNHRSWADFFLDFYVTEGQAAYLSRWAVFPVFPIFLSSAMVLKSIKFFKRNRVRDKEAFNKWLDIQLQSSPAKGLIVYPEGHRSLLQESLPLKRGMLKYAHSRGIPCQVVMTSGKEYVMSEKQFRVGFNPELGLGYSEPVDPKQYENFEDFWNRIQTVWESMWAQVHNADLSNSPIYKPRQDSSCGLNHSKLALLGQAAICSASVVGLALAIAWTTKLMLASSVTVTTSAVLAGIVYVSVQMADVR